MPINVALIGCGEHARTDLLPCLLQIPNLRLCAVCDPDDVQTARVAHLLPGIAMYRDYRPLLEQWRSFDAIVAAAPPQVHVAVATIALSHGLHVFVEKPPVVATTELERLAEMSRTAGLVTAVGHNLRYTAACTELFAWMREEAFGEPLALDVRYLASGPRGARWGLNSPMRSFLLSHAIHAIDFVQCAMGQPIAVDAAAARAEDGGMLVSARLRFKTGALSTVIVGDAGPSFRFDAWALSKSGHVIHVDSLRAVQSMGSSSRGRRWSEIWHPRTLESGQRLAGYLGELEAFFSAIASGQTASPSFEEEIVTYRIIDAIEAKSHESESKGMAPSPVNPLECAQ